MSKHIIKKQIDGVLCMQIHRPEKHNAMLPEMYAALVDGFQAAEADENVKVVLLHGVDGCFTSGNDLNGFRGAPAIDKVHPHNLFLEVLAVMRKPVMAVVSGTALGIGTIMLLHCDLVYAAPETRFSFPFTTLGLTPEGGTSYLLPRLVGYQKASEMVLFGERFSTEEALSVGIVNQVVAGDQLLETALQRAQKLAARPTAAVMAAKELLKTGTADALSQAMSREKNIFNERLASADAQGAIESFFNR